MPGFYQDGEYDVSGTIVGVVEKSKMLNGKSIRPGDAVIGLASSGLHTNGYSLARKIFFEKLKLKPTSRVAELKNTIGDELLKVHVSYGMLVQQLLKKFPGKIKGLAHITGGGFVDNIPRVLPKKCDVMVHKHTWDMLPIFQMIEAKGGVDDAETLRGVQHGHRHDGYCGGGQGGRDLEIYSRAKTNGVAYRRSGARHRRRRRLFDSIFLKNWNGAD